MEGSVGLVEERWDNGKECGLMEKRWDNGRECGAGGGTVGQWKGVGGGGRADGGPVGQWKGVGISFFRVHIGHLPVHIGDISIIHVLW